MLYLDQLHKLRKGGREGGREGGGGGGKEGGRVWQLLAILYIRDVGAGQYYHANSVRSGTVNMVLIVPLPPPVVVN